MPGTKRDSGVLLRVLEAEEEPGRGDGRGLAEAGVGAAGPGAGDRGRGAVPVRSALSGESALVIAAPQDGQNRAPSETGTAHAGQAGIARV